MKKFLVCLAMTIAAAGCRDGIDNPNDPSQVNIEFSFSDLTVGTGAEAASGNTATITYTVWLYDPAGTASKGVQQGSSSDAGSGGPYTFRIGTGQAIAGVDQGVRGMKVGGLRRIYVPSSMAYGPSGTQGGIPPNAALVFEIGLTTLLQ